jgi:hypothetical protein
MLNLLDSIVCERHGLEYAQMISLKYKILLNCESKYPGKERPCTAKKA